MTVTYGGNLRLITFKTTGYLQLYVTSGKLPIIVHLKNIYHYIVTVLCAEITHIKLKIRRIPMMLIIAGFA